MLCSNCKQRTIVSAEVLRENGYKALVDLEAYEPVGCRRCGGTGYRGRVGIYEVMTRLLGDPQLALERRSAEEIRDVAVRQGMRRSARRRPARRSARDAPRSRRSPACIGSS